MTAVFDPAEMVRVLSEHGVRFVMVGGLAALAHGAPFPTFDLDITPERSEDNLARLTDALRHLDARVRTDGVPEGLVFQHSGSSLAAGESWNLTTSSGDLDITLVPSGTAGFEDLVRDAAPVEALGVTILVASLADVVRSKQAANRPKDQRVLPTLREILRRQGEPRS